MSLVLLSGLAAVTALGHVGLFWGSTLRMGRTPSRAAESLVRGKGLGRGRPLARLPRGLPGPILKPL